MRLVFSLIALVLLSACHSKAPGRIAADVFPTATEVRLYINPSYIQIDKLGHPNKGSFPKRGIRLTSKEMTDIRKAVYYQKPKDYAMACCVPRHSFLFYNKKGKYLGEVTVCFECDCIYFSDAKPPSKDMEDVGWDYAVFTRIVKAHGQKTEFEYDPKSQ